MSDPALAGPGTISEGENLVPERAPRLATRGGSRVLLTLHDDAGSPAELTHILGLAPKAATGAVAVGWSSGTTKHYATAVTSDIALAAGTEAGSRTAFPTSWNRATPARPVWALLFEKLYVADAQTVYASRNPLVSIDAAVPPALATPTFDFVPASAGGAVGASALYPYCLAEYNNVLFIAGYDNEESGQGDDPALVRHSFLGKAPDAADGFDANAYNTIGAQGDRVTGMTKGRGLLLIAKANELYRVSGFGRAYPGWQYQVEGVQNTQGFGVENPLALEQAEGFWFGIGKEGPFRTDGESVESLVGPRQKSWRAIDNLDRAFVRYHPERRLMLFGVHVTAGAPDTTYPWVLWAWDMARNVWQPNWKLAGATQRVFIIQTIATTTVPGPSAPPSSPSTTFITTSGWTANWTNGDATAETEYWERDVDSGGSWMLVTVVAAGVVLYVRTGRLDHWHYQWRVRHRKGGVTTPFCADQSVATKIASPSFHNFVFGGGAQIRDIWNEAHGAQVTVYVLRDAVPVTHFTNQAGPNLVQANWSLTAGHTWGLYAEDLAWSPTTSATVNYST